MGMPVITPSQTTRCQAVTDIIESVALQQAQLLRFNQSVEQTIRSVAQLEVIIQSKLQLFTDCLSTCTPPPTTPE